MGASGWIHFGPYHPDLNQAFQLLCQKVFAEEEYWSSWMPPDQEREMVTHAVDTMIAHIGLEEVLEIHTQYTDAGEPIKPSSREDVINQLYRGLPKPQTIAELIDYNGQDGTHSALDFYRPDAENLAWYLSPFSDKALLHLFGTTHPTHIMIEEHNEAIWDYVLSDKGSLEGNYMVVYKDDLPDEIYVMGISGD